MIFDSAVGRLIALLALAVFSGTLVTRLTDPLVAVLARDLGGTTARAALLASAFALPFALIQPILGPVGDALGKRRVMTVAVGLLVVLLIACALGCIARAWMRRHAADAAGWRVVALSALAVPLAVSVWKRLSSMHCPWDIDRFGGGAPYFDLLATAPAHVDLVGRCFPAGFVSTSGWLLAFALLRYPQDPRFSRRAGSAAVALCLCLGMVQQMRGAHFFSHVLWTLWLSWTVILAIHAATGAWRAPLAR